MFIQVFLHLCNWLSPEWIDCLWWFTQYCQSWPKYDLEDGVSTCDNLKYLNWQLMPCLPCLLLAAFVFLHDRNQSLFWMGRLYPYLSSLYFKLKPARTGGFLLSGACIILYVVQAQKLYNKLKFLVGEKKKKSYSVTMEKMKGITAVLYWCSSK